MREIEHRIKKISFMVVAVYWILQLFWDNFIEKGQLSFGLKVILAIVISFASCFILDFPFHTIRKKSLCGFYLIVYSNKDRNPNKDIFCSVMNINIGKDGEYAINLYDYQSSDGKIWKQRGNQQYPIFLDNVYYGYSPRKIHLVSDNNDKICLCLQFANENDSNAVRYGESKPWEGKIHKLKKTELCALFNEDCRNNEFCHLVINDIFHCEELKRQKCIKRAKTIQKKVMNIRDSEYKNIPNKIYRDFAEYSEPEVNDKPNIPDYKHKKGSQPKMRENNYSLQTNKELKNIRQG